MAHPKSTFSQPDSQQQLSQQKAVTVAEKKPESVLINENIRNASTTVLELNLQTVMKVFPVLELEWNTVPHWNWR